MQRAGEGAPARDAARAAGGRIFRRTISANPRLAPLADNGGNVRTHALAPNSPGVDAAAPAVGSFFASDARGAGFAHAVGAAVDIGAFGRQVLDDELFFDGFE